MKKMLEEIKTAQDVVVEKIGQYRDTVGEALFKTACTEAPHLIMELLKKNNTKSITFEKMSFDGPSYPETGLMVVLNGENLIEFRSNEVSENYNDFAEVSGYEDIYTNGDLRDLLDELELRDNNEYTEEELSTAISYMKSLIEKAKASGITEFYEYLVVSGN